MKAPLPQSLLEVEDTLRSELSPDPNDDQNGSDARNDGDSGESSRWPSSQRTYGH
ncbi:MAG TPA: hypothetical protein VNL91_11650 [Thermoanaerobaculia bacterium]|nr:hypothetical protein [Thermoanaerobaculia bacterium]